MVSNQKSPEYKGYEMVSIHSERNKRLLSPLLEAARIGNPNTLTEFLDKGSNIFELDNTNKASVLHYATNNDDFDKALQCTQIIFDRVILHSNTEGLTRLINQPDGLQQTPLFWAASKGNDKLVNLLMNRGAKLGTNQWNQTVFHILSNSANHQQAIQCAEVLLDLKYYDSELERIKYLNTEELSSSRTALHKAAINGNHELLQLLICNGADASKADFVNSNVLHHAVGNAYESNALNCTETLLQNDIIPGWGEIKEKLLHSFDVSGKCPIHIVARRGFYKILKMMPECFLIPEGNSGFTALHASASLGNQKHAEICVREILEWVSVEDKKELLDAQDQNGCTALYLAAKHTNVEASKLLLLEGSAFDIKTKRGKTPLEKVYKKVPQAVSVLLEKAIESSGYVAYIGAINTCVELDFGPILGYSSSKSNFYKETEELGKVCLAKFEDRKDLLNHIFVKVFIHLKWERVKLLFRIFRIIHILWFLYNCFFLVTMYRVECPYKGAHPREYSWTSLRPAGEEEINVTKSLAECEISSALYAGGALNLITSFLYMLSQFHHSKQRFNWLFRPMKTFEEKTPLFKKITKTLSYYFILLIHILPCWPLLITAGIVITTLPAFGLILFEEAHHYIIAGLMGLLIWLAIYLELGKFPKFRVYINLLMRSTQTLLLAIAVTAPILFGFANVFVVLIPGEPSFSSAAQSFVKVITFMIGELDYDDLFYGEEETVFLGIVMLSLAVFIVIIVVLLVNFLIGLAAEEIRDFWERAEIWKLCTQLDQIVMLESFLDETVTLCGREFLRKKLMLMPPEKNDRQIMKQRRRARIDIPSLPKQMQKELHDLNLNTIQEIK